MTIISEDLYQEYYPPLYQDYEDTFSNLVLAKDDTTEGYCKFVRLLNVINDHIELNESLLSENIVTDKGRFQLLIVIKRLRSLQQKVVEHIQHLST